MFGIGTYFAGWDEFGQSAKFNYRGESGYGTGLGGCCSLFVTILTALFISIQLIGMFNPSYNSVMTTTYLGSEIGIDPDHVPGYDIQTGDLVPTFMTITNNGEDPIEYNSETFFKFQFNLLDKMAGTTTPVPAILCSDPSYIDGPFWEGFSQEEKDNFLQQLQFPDH